MPTGPVSIKRAKIKLVSNPICLSLQALKFETLVKSAVTRETFFHAFLLVILKMLTIEKSNIKTASIITTLKLLNIGSYFF